MRKTFLSLSLAVMAMLMSVSTAFAQTPANKKAQPKPSLSSLVRQASTAKTQKDFAALPVFMRRQQLLPHNTFFPVATASTSLFTPSPLSKAPLRANANREIWANVVSMPSWTDDSYGPFGWYSFTPSDPLNFTSLFETSDRRVAESGVQYSHGHIYSEQWISHFYSDTLRIYVYDTDTKTGETTRTEYGFEDYQKFVACATAQAIDGTVYGQFYNSTGTGTEYGTVDFRTMTRTTIAPAHKTFIVMGITSNGELYGVDVNADLYKIDTTTGEETLIGATGLNLWTQQGGYYSQAGAIDQSDDTFYWAALDGSGKGGLYTIDLNTGHATKIADGAYQLFGMIIPGEEIPDAAPERVADAKVTFNEADHNGVVSFTAPTTTYSGGALSGDLTYTVSEHDSVITSGTAAPGEQVSKDIYVENEGQHTFTIKTKNDAGESQPANVTKWVGYDTPKNVTNVQAVVNGHDVTITWDPTTSGVHKGYIGTPTYNIYYWDGEDGFTPIAKGLTETSYVNHEPKTSGFATYRYVVGAEANGKESLLYPSNSVRVGDAFEPDWSEDFSSEDTWDLFTVIDANEDGATWTYNSDRQAARSWYNSSNGNDDWLITPPIHMSPDRTYTISFDALNANSANLNSLEVKWGKGKTPEELTNTLLETTQPNAGDNYQSYSFTVTPPEDGNYYIGFHDNTPLADQYWIYVTNIKVEKVMRSTAPNAVGNLTVTPGERGSLNANVTFQAPSANISGGSIDKVDSIELTRNGKLIETFRNVAAGSNISYADNNITKNGTYEYTAIPYVGDEAGVKATASAFVGVDVPQAPSNVALSDNVTDIIANWDKTPAKGANGGYVNPDEVMVSFFDIDRNSSGGGTVSDSLTTSEAGATTAEIPHDPEVTRESDGTTQMLYQVAAQANGEGGQSDYGVSGSLVVGPSIALPFKESFTNANVDNNFAWMFGNVQWASKFNSANWLIWNDNTADNDGGAIFWKPYSQQSWFGTIDYIIDPGDELSFNTPKITLKGAANPKLYFKLYSTVDNPAHLKVLIQTPDGVDHEASDYDLTTTTNAGWTTKSVDLSDYASERYIMVKFNGVASGSDVCIGVDDINVFDQLQYNLAARSITTPEKVNAGKTCKADVVVENIGSQAASGYSVVLYANNEAVDTVTVNDELPTFGTDTVSLEFPVAINQAEPISVKASVVYSDDLDNDDNTTETNTVAVIPSAYPKVNDLSASGAEDGISLSWSKPVIPKYETVTEDFESYDAWATQFGDWTLVDGDNGLAAGFYRNYTYPGQGTAFAFDIFNPNAITDEFDVVENNPGFAPHSGNQFAGAPYLLGANGGYVDADNWLISPELSGNKQTIKFYAFNVAGNNVVYKEKFDVLYSTEGTDTADFVKLESDVADGTNLIGDAANWKEFNVELPEGAKYFAINHNSDMDNNYLFGLDDITYEKAHLAANDSVIAYNIYRDGKLVGSVKGNVLTYLDTDADAGVHIYNITVVYQSKNGDVNESGFSNDASITVTGIDGVSVNAEGKYNVYTIDGKTIMIGAKSLNGLKPGLYIINDKKYIIK